MKTTDIHTSLTNEYATRHFKYNELACPCCGELIVSAPFIQHMALLEDLREQCGFPLLITSGYRCPYHNKEVGGAPKSQHMQFATDVCPVNDNPDSVRQIYKIALAQPWTGIGYDEGEFVHLDLRTGKRIIWRY